MRYTKKEFAEIVKNHVAWVKRRPSGRVANFSGANLSGVDLSLANLSHANLSGANLSNVNLSGANLSGANLSGANLSDSNLTGSNLTFANLTGVNLAFANLAGARLTGVCGIKYASCTFSSHGEYGRELRAISWTIDGEYCPPVYACGCFYGSESELLQFITEDKEELTESRMAAYRFVSTQIMLELEAVK